jgi:hypothetical protein
MELRKRDESPTKEFVDVMAIHWSENGGIDPKRIHLKNGAVLLVSRVFTVTRAASLCAGGQGIRYECRVANAEDGFEFRIYLFHDGDYWFIEKTKDGGDILCVDGAIQKLGKNNWGSS